MLKPEPAVTGGWKISSPEPRAGSPTLCVEGLLKGVVWARFRGPLDTVVRPEVTRQLLELLDLPIAALNLDLSGVTFIDSSGIGLLIVASTHALLRGVELTLEHASPVVCVALERTGLAERFNLPCAFWTRSRHRNFRN
jgi:anti-anti-sigma factor